MSIIGGASFVVLAALLLGLLVRGGKHRLDISGNVLKKPFTRYSPLSWVFKENDDSNETSDDILKAGYGSGSLDDSSYRRPPPILVIPSEISATTIDEKVLEKDIEAVSLHQGLYSPMDSPSSFGTSSSINSSPKRSKKFRIFGNK